MQTYCLESKGQTYNSWLPKIIVTNKVIRQKSKCANCTANKSLFFKKGV